MRCDEASSRERPKCRVAVIVAVYNRRELTLRLLRSLSCISSVDVSVFLFDDSSPDGTAASVREQFPNVNLVVGDGSSYWAGGMRQAWRAADASGRFDFYLWLNDDVILADQAVERLITAAKRCETLHGRPCLIVGTTVGADGQPTYGGRIRRAWWDPYNFVICPPGLNDRECITINGNITLIPTHIASVVGGIDAVFTHGLGDWDYGLRVRRLGFPVIVAAGVFGICERNPPVCVNSVRSALRLVLSTKHLPLRPWATFCFRHFGVLAPVYFMRPYVAALLNGLRLRFNV